MLHLYRLCEMVFKTARKFSIIYEKGKAKFPKFFFVLVFKYLR